MNYAAVWRQHRQTTVNMTVGPPKDIPWQRILSPDLANKRLRTDLEQACGNSGTILQFLCSGARPDLTYVQNYPQTFNPLAPDFFLNFSTPVYKM